MFKNSRGKLEPLHLLLNGYYVILNRTEPEVIETQKFNKSNNSGLSGIHETCRCEFTKGHEDGEHEFVCLPRLGFISAT